MPKGVYDRRGKRKTSPRPDVHGKPRPKTSEAMRRRYQDPEARMRATAHLRNHPGRGRPVGVYDGYRKADSERINAAAKEYAKEIIKDMTAKGIITPEDDPRATEALEAAVAVMRTPANQTAKLSAAKLILEYTKAKPAAKSEITVNKAEEWLAEIAKTENDDEEGTAGDAKAAP